MTRTPWPRAVGVGAALALVVTLLVLAFAWPTAKAAPRDVPLGLVGPAAAVTQVEQALAAKAPGGFDVTTYPDADAARDAVAHHDLDGALVLAGPSPQLLVASAGSPTLAQLLEEVATQAATALGGTPPASPVVVTDVVPAPADDARGAVLTAGMLPAVIGSIVVGAVSALVVRGRTRRLATLGVAAVGAGLLVGLVLGPWRGALPSAYAAVAGSLALGVAASACVVAGLHAVAGRAGLVLAAAVVLLVGNPASGAAAPTVLLPAFWGGVGPWLPPGATADLLRAVTFVDGAHAAAPLLTLVAWTVVGAVLVVVGRGAGRRAARGPDPEVAEPAEHGSTPVANTGSATVSAT
jgi:hypothetical protein